jgi:hypothetical protein
VSTDGQGHSLTIVNPAAALESWNSADAWRASLTMDGSPGIDDDVDFNRDGQTNVADIDRFCAGYASHDLRYDLTHDGVIDLGDLVFLIEDVWKTRFGDSNLDREFETGDLVLVFASAQYEDAIARNSGWADGDWNCDGDFTSGDLVLAFTRGGMSSPAVRWAEDAAWLDDLAAAAVDQAIDREKMSLIIRIRGSKDDDRWFQKTEPANPGQA